VPQGLRDNIRLFFSEKGFEIADADGELVWQKRKMLSFHNVIARYAFDVVIIMVFIRLPVGIKGFTEAGPDGFAAIIEKRPLKKIVGELEKIAENG